MNAMSKSKPKAEKAVPEAEAMKPAEPAAEPQRSHSTERKSRGRMRVLLMAALPLALVIGGGYVWVTGGRYQETENAYLRQPKVTIASQASRSKCGRVKRPQPAAATASPQARNPASKSDPYPEISDS